MSTTQQKPSELKVRPGDRTIADSWDGERYHFGLGITPEMNDLMEKLALKLNARDKAAVLTKAIGLLNWASDAAVEGKGVCIVDKDGEIEREIVGLLDQ